MEEEYKPTQEEVDEAVKSAEKQMNEFQKPEPKPRNPEPTQEDIDKAMSEVAAQFGEKLEEGIDEKLYATEFSEEEMEKRISDYISAKKFLTPYLKKMGDEKPEELKTITLFDLQNMLEEQGQEASEMAKAINDLKKNGIDGETALSELMKEIDRVLTTALMVYRHMIKKNVK